MSGRSSNASNVLRRVYPIFLVKVVTGEPFSRLISMTYAHQNLPDLTGGAAFPMFRALEEADSA
jgi:hypothetical protein